ncbi:hypothetical protein M407DRAFT_208452 [Tulasnella calospora MUT 4182]|uniref:Uncharacterized protein n=1 Tax=Tulasnella calospora MUT 4182 TaxID=1051891 RepID=A0A0C3QI85_9AGAM|nr:hypothetical protein M407DRAFT_208452 [Tulasnella calospora MUT 4182]
MNLRRLVSWSLTKCSMMPIRIKNGILDGETITQNHPSNSERIPRWSSGLRILGALRSPGPKMGDEAGYSFSPAALFANPIRQGHSWGINTGDSFTLRTRQTHSRSCTCATLKGELHMVLGAFKDPYSLLIHPI